MTKYPARLHARKVISELREIIPENDRTKRQAIFLQGAPVTCRFDTDRELPFHQEANFFYLTGCDVPSSSVLITFTFDTSELKHDLFIPPAVPEETVWSVPPPSLEEARVTYDSDDIQHTTKLSSAIHQALNSDIVLHVLPVTLDYPPLPATIANLLRPTERSNGFLGLSHTSEYLLTALQRSRITKTSYEIDLLREANRISSQAHEVLMRELGKHANRRKESQKGNRKVRTGKEMLSEWEVKGEQDAAALFEAICKRMGAGMSYLPICASGTRASTLHYVCNDKLFPSTSMPRKSGDTSWMPRPLARGCCGSVPDHDHTVASGHHEDSFMPQVLLIDAACEWENYAADITRTLPIGNGGRFTPRHGEIYDVVLRMQKECESMVRPGAHWDTLHLHGHKVLIDSFLALGIFTGEPSVILQSGITAAFFPHGLGHAIGLDVHDSRQELKAVHLNLPPESLSTPAKLYSYLRIRRPLKVGMCVTVEPGCYFPPQLMELHGVWESEYVDKDKLREYVSVGGVRIEDTVVVTEDGWENLTMVVRERADVEAFTSGER
ncbi:hypothetical protein TREMEDRAFT_42855 [Tremella mesenterica DSM 1558]|uniref:uncharacterized protein n=1 Tax=Tremella mesenterica (strain ATCC 24925 / CBS 8224 / DSM 1558 / NBRC 9311 / NRRL Y-6157 / RJB 2259-6 / UBC 559-6) TaxID=578456 RepID=UPI0003F498B0|nr:uncharacterized protein TREMEDRAFT_42855 [Tremella mesenterica DSM 1558]EIW71477.1 hypothetical protein TREMEDRAFT_42855 [Tremella mesenterica DSM 1558]